MNLLMDPLPPRRAPLPRFAKDTPFVLQPYATVTLVKEPATYQQVLELRLDCYREAEKVPANTSAESMRVKNDEFSQIYAVMLGRKLVGSFKIFIPKENEIMESVDGALGSYPADLPPKKAVIEVSSLCIRKGFRSPHLLKLVFSQVHKSLVKCRRSYILISADTRLQPKYKFIGFSRTGYGYKKPNSKFADLEIMISRQKIFGTYGLHADPIRWNLYLREANDQLLAEGILHHNFFQRVWFGSFRSLARPAAWIEHSILRAQIRKL